jgi:hypothetical protein
MSITAVVGHFMSGFLDTVRRSAIAYSICALCVIAIVILGTCAAVMALIPMVGAVYAQLIVAAVYLMVIIVTMIWLQRRARPAPAPRATPAGAGAEIPQQQAQIAQIAMIIEAMMLGYSMSRRRR